MSLVLPVPGHVGTQFASCASRETDALFEMRIY
jgi:hypothetical protein